MSLNQIMLRSQFVEINIANSAKIIIHLNDYLFLCIYLQVMRILIEQDTGPMSASDFSKCKAPKRLPLDTDVSQTFNVSHVHIQ